MSQVSPEVDDSWRLNGRYCSHTIYGGVADAARGLQNLVNVQGAGPIAVLPRGRRASLAAKLRDLDPTSSWQDWWRRSSGEQIELVDVSAYRRQVPVHALPRKIIRNSRALGVNIGGHYLRRVWLAEGRVDRADSVRLGTGSESRLFGATVQALSSLLAEGRQPDDVQCIGIAWSAPRTRLGLRAMSVQTQGAGEVAALLDRGEIDAVLGRLCRCPVSSWNDGEAVAAAELMLRPASRARPLLVLKLGTSLATGLAIGEGVCALPLQLAKSVLKTRPIKDYEHPIVGLRGTARDLLGAERLARTFEYVAGRPSATYRDFCEAAVGSDPGAGEIVRTAAAGLAELSELVADLWSPLNVVLTGKNIEDPAFRDLLNKHLRRELAAQLSPRAVVCAPLLDVDLCAAVGAALLALSRLQ